MTPYLLRLFSGVQKPGTCKYCQAPILWCITDRNKDIPMNADLVVRETVTDPSTGKRWDLVHREHAHFGSCARKPAARPKAEKPFTHPRRTLLELAE
jgi:hypothetical protein